MKLNNLLNHAVVTHVRAGGLLTGLVGLGMTLVCALAACKGHDGASPDLAGASADTHTVASSDPSESGGASAGRSGGGTTGAGAVADGGGEPAETARPKPAPLPTPADAGTCPDEGRADLGIFVSPGRAVASEPLRIVAATLTGETALAVRVEVQGKPIDAEVTHRPGVPAAAIARLSVPTDAKTLKIIVGREGEGLACATVKVTRSAASRPRRISSDGVWPIVRRWSASEEALFSAWVREMFHAEPGESLAWKALHEVTSDAARNLLHDHYRWREDDPNTKLVGLYLKPDCADTPYFLRAYYAWKRQLPFAFRQCSRGNGGKAPHCGKLHPILGTPEHAPDSKKAGEVGAVQRYFRRTLAWGVHTGNGRCAFADSGNDFYPVALTRRSLRPGTMYADPYGHIFVLAELVDPRGEDPGILYAVDGQPDGSITRKRFWEGNFLWNPDPALGGSGFKAFRPLDVVKLDGTRTLVAATNEQIVARKGYGDFSEAQSSLTPPAFYDRMDTLITPGVRDPFRAQDEAIVALSEAVGVRVTSVSNGEAFVAKSSGVIAMPAGHSIFETTGAWENYSTPARDLRILIAIDVATGFANKIARNAEAFGVGADEADAVNQKLAAARDARLADPSLAITYTRSDGSEVTLTMAELVARRAALEVAYNPNDCPEVRWGAAEGSKERKTCKRRAPAEQQRKLKAYRPWFRERRRPGRGDPGPHVD